MYNNSPGNYPTNYPNNNPYGGPYGGSYGGGYGGYPSIKSSRFSKRAYVPPAYNRGMPNDNYGQPMGQPMPPPDAYESANVDHKNGKFNPQELLILQNYCRFMLWRCSEGKKKIMAAWLAGLMYIGDPGISLLENQSRWMYNLEARFIYPYTPRPDDTTDLSYKLGSLPHVNGTISSYTNKEGNLVIQQAEVACTYEQQITLLMSFIIQNIDPVHIRQENEPEDLYHLRIIDMFYANSVEEVQQRFQLYMTIMTPVRQMMTTNILNPNKVSIMADALSQLIQNEFIVIEPFHPMYRFVTSGIVSWSSHCQQLVDRLDDIYDNKNSRYKQNNNAARFDWPQPQTPQQHMQQQQVQQQQVQQQQVVNNNNNDRYEIDEI